jgi:hypothetical protein
MSGKSDRARAIWTLARLAVILVVVTSSVIYPSMIGLTPDPIKNASAAEPSGFEDSFEDTDFSIYNVITSPSRSSSFSTDGSYSMRLNDGDEIEYHSSDITSYSSKIKINDGGTLIFQSENSNGNAIAHLSFRGGSADDIYFMHNSVAQFTPGHTFEVDVTMYPDSETFDITIKDLTNGSTKLSRTGVGYDNSGPVSHISFQTFSGANTYFDQFQTNDGPSWTVSGKVLNQHGDPINDATVVAYATTLDSTSYEEGEQTFENLSDPTPKAWKKIPNNPNLLGNYWSADNVDSYVSTHTKGALPETSPWIDNANLDDTATIGASERLPANEDIILAAWDADATGLGQNQCLPGVGNEYNCQMPGMHKKSATIVIEKIGAGGGTITKGTATLDQTSGGGLADPDRLKYTTVSLQPGFYYIYEKGASKGPPRKVGEVSTILDKYRKKANGELSKNAKKLKDKVDQGSVKEVTTSTNAKGKFSVKVPGSASTVSLQAIKSTGVAKQYENLSKVNQAVIRAKYGNSMKLSNDLRDPYERSVANSSVYMPSDTEVVSPPKSHVRIKMWERSGPPDLDINDSQNHTQWLENITKNTSFNDLPGTVQDPILGTINETINGTEDPTPPPSKLIEVYKELRGTVESNDQIREKYLQLSDRDQIAPANELTESELRREIQHMSKAIRLYDSVGIVRPGPIEPSNETVSLSWTVPGMDVSAANVSIMAHYANGTSAVVPSEYIAVDSTMVGDDVVRLEKYPLGEKDPASVQFDLKISGTDGLRRGEKVVKNPTLSGSLPTIDSIQLTAITPGPNQNVTLTVNPAESGSYRSLSNVTVYAPDGRELNTSDPSNNSVSWTTAGKGVHHVRLTIESTNGATVELPVRVKALGTDPPRPPTLTARQSPVGLYALTSGGIDSASIESSSAGETVDVTAQFEQGKTPTELDVHLEEMSIPGDSTTRLTLVQGTQRQVLTTNVPVRVYYKATGTDLLVWRNGEPIPEDGSKWGSRTSTGSTQVIDTYTDGQGTLEIRKTHDPTLPARINYWIDNQLASIPELPFWTVPSSWSVVDVPEVVA